MATEYEISNADTYANIDNINSPNHITPQSFETNNGRFHIEVFDEDELLLTTTDLPADNEKYMQDSHDDVQTLYINSEDLDVLIDILIKAKQMNTKRWTGNE